MKKVLILSLIGLLSTSFTVPKENKPLTKENLWEAINELGIKYPDLVFAQAILESGELKSKITKYNNNVFGMKYPNIRSTTAIGINRGHAVYSHWTESIKDYKIYQDFIFEKKKISNRKTYIFYLNKVYSEVNDYSKRLNRVLSEHKILLKRFNNG